jgi:hypothetical protein
MSTEPHKLTYEAASAIAKYIFANPGKSGNQILNGLNTSGYNVSKMDWNKTENILTDRGIVDVRCVEIKSNNGKLLGWYHGYFPKDTSIESVENQLQGLLKKE